MLREREAVIRRALILLDAAVISFAFFFAFVLRKNVQALYSLKLIPSSLVIRNISPELDVYLVLLLFAAPIWCLLLYVNRMYVSFRLKKITEIIWIIIKSSIFLILIYGSVVFLFRLEFVSRFFSVIFFMSCVIFTFTEKMIIFSFMHYARKRGYNYRVLLIVGTGRRAASFIKKIQAHQEWGLRILGVIDDEPDRGIKKVENVNVIGSLDEIPDLLHKNAIDEVVFVVPRSRLSHMENAISACELEGIGVSIAVDLFDLKIAKSSMTEIEGIPLVRFDTTVAKEWQLFVKRSFDVLTSGLGLILVSPILLVVAILIKLTSSGPILFRQERLGLNGRRFVLLKFRTMYKGAQEKLGDVNVVRDMNDPAFMKKKIKYMTPLGKVLRKFSLDELPQLFNVFVGHMSLIGPRPTVPEEVSQYASWQRRRLSMRPGLSCLWQISGRNKISFEEWMKLDLEYLDNWSLRLDFMILVKTIPTVFFGIGAY